MTAIRENKKRIISFFAIISVLILTFSATAFAMWRASLNMTPQMLSLVSATYKQTVGTQAQQTGTVPNAPLANVDYDPTPLLTDLKDDGIASGSIVLSGTVDPYLKMLGSMTTQTTGVFAAPTTTLKFVSVPTTTTACTPTIDSTYPSNIIYSGVASGAKYSNFNIVTSGATATTGNQKVCFIVSANTTNTTYTQTATATADSADGQATASNTYNLSVKGLPADTTGTLGFIGNWSLARP